MDIYVCGGKQTQGNNTIYLLKDVRNNKEITVSGDELKNAMKNKKVDVMNLTLTSDNRLVEASKDKIAQLGGLLNAPYRIREYLDPLNPKYVDDVEDIMDEIIRDAIETYVKDCKKYVKISSINKENNTLVLEFTLGLNSYVMCHYDKMVYGEVNQKATHSERNAYGHYMSSIYSKDAGAICFDIGIQVLGISNKRASSKIGSGNIIKAAEYVNDSWDAVALRLNYETDTDGKLTWKDDDIDKLKKKLGKFIVSNIARELVETCENNPDIMNNTNIADYVKYDSARKEYAKGLAIVGGVSLGSTLVLTAVFTLLISISTDTIQTGLLAKIAGMGSTKEIITYILGMSGIPALAIGTGITGKALTETGAIKTLKNMHDDVRDTRNNKRKDWMGALGKKS